MAGLALYKKLQAPHAEILISYKEVQPCEKINR